MIDYTQYLLDIIDSLEILQGIGGGLICILGIYVGIELVYEFFYSAYNHFDAPLKNS